jgi:hypothetical protein
MEEKPYQRSGDPVIEKPKPLKHGGREEAEKGLAADYADKR